MILRSRLCLPLLIGILFLSTSALSALTSTPGSFCKCICNTNSTIIALNPSTTSPAFAARQSFSKHHSLTCADCTRSFCASYNLPICKDVADEQIFTSCFQRDSLKDELVIYLFLTVTTGLLVWAGIKPWVEKARERAGFGVGSREGAGAAPQRQESQYVPLERDGERSEGDGIAGDPDLR